MSGLTGNKVQNTYKDLLKISNSNAGLDSSIRTVDCGSGIASPLGLSSTTISLNGMKFPTAPGNMGDALLFNGVDQLYFSAVAAPSANATTIDVTASTTNATFYPVFASANGSSSSTLYSTGSISLNPSTDTVSATTFAGALTGNATTATALQVARAIGGVSFDGSAAITPQNIQVTNSSSNLTFYPAFYSNTSGNLQPTTNSGLSFNPSTATLTTTTFSGALTGNVTGNVSGSSGSCTGNSATVTTNANLTGPITSVGNATSIASKTGTGTTFVVDTGPTLVTPILGVATATTINKVALTAPATGSTLTIADGATLTVSNSATVTNGTHSGTNTGDQLIFKTISVSGQSDVIADTSADTLTLVAGSNMTITTNATTDTITFASSGGGGGLSDGDYGDVTVSGSTTVLTVDSVTVADAAGDTTTWPMLSRSVTGSSQVVSTDSGLTYNATTHNLATTTFTGALAGNATTATTLATTRAIGGVNFDGSAAITPANITIGNEATDTTCFPLFTTAATGDLPPKSNTSLTFNSNTANLGCTTFTGALVGNVTGNVSGSSGSCTGNSATVTTNANLTGVITSSGNATSIASQTGTGTKFVVDNAPTLITPVLGIATATTINKVALTAPATGSTLTIADGQTLTVNGSATITNGTHSGTNTGDQTSVSGNAGTATALQTARAIGGVNFDGTAAITPNNITAANDVTNATYYPAYFSAATGAVQPKTNTGFTVNPSTNTVTATTFVGALTGNASGSSGSCTGNAATATALATTRAIGGVNFDGTAAITPQNITPASDTTNATYYPAYFSATSGNLQPKVNTGFSVNPSTNAVTATTFIGALTGNVTGNTSGSSGSCTGNAATVTTNANLTGEVTSSGNAAVLSSTALTNRTLKVPDPSVDYVLIYDVAGTALKTVLIQNIANLGLDYCMARNVFCG